MDAPVLALFNDSHMEYEADRADDDEPSLADMTQKAIEFLSQNENGYYLEIEAGRVDHANHDGNAARVVRAGVAFADAAAMAAELTDEADMLIIVTADHEHSIAMNGYCGCGSDIMGLCYDVAQTGDKHSDELVLGSDGKPFTVVGYAEIAVHENVDIAAPLVFGDSFGTAPVIVTTEQFARYLADDRIKGRMWQTETEAVAGALVPLAIGDGFIWPTAPATVPSWTRKEMLI